MICSGSAVPRPKMELKKNLTEDEIRFFLSQGSGSHPKLSFYRSEFPPELLPEPPLKAAVLVPMYKKRGRWYILFTRRTATLPEHSGQVAFPGGRTDSEEESPEYTALREAEEEINLKPQDVRILGRLAQLRTISNYLVTPVIGRIPPVYNFKLASEEVSRIFSIPLDWLADPNHYEIRMRKLPNPFPAVPVIYYRPYDGELLWGVSAEITLNLLAALNRI